MRWMPPRPTKIRHQRRYATVVDRMATLPRDLALRRAIKPHQVMVPGVAAVVQRVTCLVVSGLFSRDVQRSAASARRAPLHVAAKQAGTAGSALLRARERNVRRPGQPRAEA